MPLSWTSALANDRTTRTPLTSRIRKNWRNNAMYVAYLNSGSFPCLFDGPHVDRQHMDGYNTIQYNTSTGSRTASDSSLSVTRTELLFHTESPLYPAINSMRKILLELYSSMYCMRLPYQYFLSPFLNRKRVPSSLFLIVNAFPVSMHLRTLQERHHRITSWLILSTI